MIEKKNEEMIEVTDIANYAILTNNDFQSLIESADRRYFALEASDKMCPDKEGAKEYWNQMYDSLMNINAGNHIFHYLVNKDISKFDTRDLPITAYKKILKTNQTNSIIKFLIDEYNELMQIDDKFLENYNSNKNDKDTYLKYTEWCKDNGEKILSKSVMASKMKNIGIVLKQKKIKQSNGSRKSEYYRDLSKANLCDKLAEFIIDFE
jgi:hypothetical protein